MDTAKKRKGHGKITSNRLPRPCKSSLVCVDAKKRRLWKSKPPFQMGVSNCLLYDGFFSFTVVRQVVSFALILTSNSHRNVTDILCFDRIMGWNLTSLWDFKIYCLFFIEFLFSETGQFPKQKLEMLPTENIPSIYKGHLLCFHPSFPLCQTHLQVGWPVQSVADR